MKIPILSVAAYCLIFSLITKTISEKEFQQKIAQASSTMQKSDILTINNFDDGESGIGTKTKNAWLDAINTIKSSAPESKASLLNALYNAAQAMFDTSTGFYNQFNGIQKEGYIPAYTVQKNHALIKNRYNFDQTFKALNEAMQNSQKPIKKESGFAKAKQWFKNKVSSQPSKNEAALSSLADNFINAIAGLLEKKKMQIIKKQINPSDWKN